MIIGVWAGAILGVIIGGSVGASIGSWSWGLVGAYGGLACGATVIGGVVAMATAGNDREQRAEGRAGLVFGSFGTVGAFVGYRVGTEIERMSPVVGCLLGLALMGALAAIFVDHLFRERDKHASGGVALALLLLLAVSGAGGGAWIGMLAHHAIWVAVGLVAGSLFGTLIAHALNEGVEEAVRGGPYRGGPPCGS
ncbi:hypothetical protein [Flindersiella endophytica]